MAHPEAESSGANVEIRPDEVHAIAGHVGEVRELIAKATTSGATPVSTATTAGAAALAGWSSAAVLSDVLRQWSRKSRALTDGPGGLDDFAAALKGLVTDTTATDGRNAKLVANTGAIDKTMESFREPFNP